MRIEKEIANEEQHRCPHKRRMKKDIVISDYVRSFNVFAFYVIETLIFVGIQEETQMKLVSPTKKNEARYCQKHLWRRF